MHLFLAFSAPRPVDEARCAEALAVAQALADASPGLAGARSSSWRSPSGHTVVVDVGHPPERRGGPSRAWGDERRRHVLDGFPIDRTGPLPGDGPVAVAGLDGRFVALTADEDEVAVVSDRIGAHTAYVRTLPDGTVATSPSPVLLARLSPRRAPDEVAMVDFVVAGWIPGDRSAWEDVRPLPPGRSVAVRGRLQPSSTRLIDLALEAASRPVHRDPTVGAELLRDAVAATAREARGPLELGLSGGRDSRVILSAAIAAGVRPHCYTSALEEDPAFPDTGDVVAARRLTQELGLEHEVRVSAVHADDSERWMRAVTAGVSPFDATPSHTDTTGPTPTVLSGAAGELGWLTLGIDLTKAPAEEAIRGAVDAFVLTFPPPLAPRAAAERTKERARAIARSWHQEGVPADLLAESYFAFERTSARTAPALFAYEPFFDAVAPAWSADMLPLQWSLDARDRELDRWRRAMVHELCPEIAALPFSGAATGWPDDADRSSYMLWGEKMDKIRRFTRSRIVGSGIRRLPEQAAALRRMQAEFLGALRADDRLHAVLDVRRTTRLARASVNRMDPRTLQRLVRVGHVVRVYADAP